MKKARIIYLILGLITAAIVASQEVVIQSSLNHTVREVNDWYEMISGSGDSAENMQKAAPLIAYTLKE